MKTVRVVGMVLFCLALLLVTVDCGKSDKTPPSVAPNLTCTTLCHDNTPTFTWDAATDGGSGVDHYSVAIQSVMDLSEKHRVWVNVGDVTTYTYDSPLHDGQYGFVLKAVDKAGNEGTALICPFLCDTIAPTISNISAFAYACDNGKCCRIFWKTNELAHFQVEYGTTPAYGASQPAPFVNAMIPKLEYDVDLTSLIANTTYHYRVKAVDLCGNEAVSDDYTFHMP